MSDLWVKMVALIALLAGPPGKAAEVYTYAPVYTSSGVPGVLARIGSFRYKPVEGFEVLYCTLNNTASSTVLCVVHAPKDRLMLFEMDATEHKT